MGISRDAVRQALEAEVYLEPANDRASTPQAVDSYVEDLTRLTPFFLVSRLTDSVTPPSSTMNKIIALNRTLADFNNFIDDKANGLREIDNPGTLSRLRTVVREWNRITLSRSRLSTLTRPYIDILEANAVAAEETYGEAGDRVREFRRDHQAELQAAETEYHAALSRARREAHSGRGQRSVDVPDLIRQYDRARGRVSRLGSLAQEMRSVVDRLKENVQRILDDDDGPDSPVGSGRGGGTIGGSSGANGHGVSFMSRIPRVRTSSYSFLRGAIRFGGNTLNFGRNCVSYIFAAEALALAYARTVAWPWISAQAVNWGSRALSVIRSAGPAIRSIANTPAFRLATLGPRIGLAITGFVAGLASSLVSLVVGINGAAIEDVLNRDPNDPFGHGGVA
jgi:hypothetical protein